MAKKLYVGNLPFTSSQEDLESLFSRHGTVASVNVITDRETGRTQVRRVPLKGVTTAAQRPIHTSGPGLQCEPGNCLNQQHWDMPISHHLELQPELANLGAVIRAVVELCYPAVIGLEPQLRVPDLDTMSIADYNDF